ncbi:MAG: B12-binding domain-containing protein [Nitrososphaerales archaeon]
MSTTKRYSLEEIKRKVIDVLRDVDTGLSGIEIAEKTGINRITITKYLSVLEAIGLIKRKKVGSVNVWHLQQGVTELELPIDILDVQRLYMDAVFRGAEDEARRLIINVIHSDVDPVRVLAEVIAPTINTAGELYSRGRMTVTEVMFITNLIDESLDLIKFNAEREEVKQDAYAVFMSAQGEMHTLGPKVASVAFYLRCWAIYFLGNVASEVDLLFDIDLLKFLDKIWKTERGVMVLGVSVTLKERLKSIAQTIKSVREKLRKNVHVLDGGEAFRTEDALTQSVEADFIAKDLYSAVEWAEKLYGKGR